MKRTARTKALWKVFLLEVKRHHWCPCIHTVLMVWLVFLPLQWIMGTFAPRRRLHDQGETRVNVPPEELCSFSLMISGGGGGGGHNNTSYVFSLLWGILASDNTLRWYNVVTLIVWTQRCKAQKICHRFSLSIKQCSGKVGLEKCKMWRHPGSSWCAGP